MRVLFTVMVLLGGCSATPQPDATFTITRVTLGADGDERGQNRNVYLGSYCHLSSCLTSWNGLVKSYYTGDNGTYLYRYYNDGYDGAEYFPGTRLTRDAGTYGQASNYLYFTSCIL